MHVLQILCVISQTVVTHVAEFRQLAALTTWNDAVLKEVFYQSISEEMKDELARIDRPKEVQVFYDAVI